MKGCCVPVPHPANGQSLIQLAPACLHVPLTAGLVLWLSTAVILKGIPESPATTAEPHA